MIKNIYIREVRCPMKVHVRLRACTLEMLKVHAGLCACIFDFVDCWGCRWYVLRLIGVAAEFL